MRLTYLVIVCFVILLSSHVTAAGCQNLFEKTDSLAIKGNYESAITLLEEALHSFEADPQHSDSIINTVLLKLGHYYYKDSRFEESETMIQRVLTSRRNLLGETHPLYAEAMDKLGGLRYEQGRSDEAAKLWTQALLILESTLGENHPDFVRALYIRSCKYEVRGWFADAERGFLRVLKIMKITTGSSDSGYAGTLCDLSTTYWYMGKLAKAEPMGREALAISSNIYGERHPLTVKALNNLGIVLMTQHRDSEAEELFKRSLVACKIVNQNDHERILSIMNNLAIIYKRSKQNKKAMALNKEVLALKEEIYGPEHRSLSTTLINLAINYQSQGDYTKAEELYRRQLIIKEKAHGKMHPSLVYGLKGLSSVLIRRKKYTEAAPLYTRMLSIDSIYYGVNHQLYANHLGTYGSFLWLTGERDSALVVLLDAFRSWDRNFKQNSLVLSEEDALSFSRSLRKSADEFLSNILISGTIDSTMLNAAGNVILTTKGAVSDDIFTRRRLLVSETDSGIVALADKYKEARTALAKYYVRAGFEPDPHARQHRLDSLSKEVDSLEHTLSMQSLSFRNRHDLQDVRLERIASLLPKQSTLVEYMRYQRYLTVWSDTTQDYYLVTVTGPEGIRQISDLGEAAIIDSAVATYQRHIRNVAGLWPQLPDSILTAGDSIIRQLYELVWQPIVSNIDPDGLVFVSPDGGLNLVSFSGLKGPDGDYLVERHPMHFLSAGRDLVRLCQILKPGNGLIIFGDPDYDAKPELRLTSSVSDIPTDQEKDKPGTLRNLGIECILTASVRATPLPYTRREAKRLSKNWSKRTGQKPTVLLGAAASEENFKRLAPGKLAIHLATHGFFTSEYCLQSEDESVFANVNPLLLSGLLFAGANLKGEENNSIDIDDGVLTAYEVAGMNLDGTRRVVLSACQSGIGEIQAGEGVYGLSRAFQIAGARTVVSSLWSVPDKETARIMAHLYGSEHNNLAYAMQGMAIEQIRRLRTSNLPDHPYTWSAFVAHGDWMME